MQRVSVNVVCAILLFSFVFLPDFRIYGQSTNQELDIVTGNHASKDIAYYPGNGDGTFQYQSHQKAKADQQSIAIADFNEDGIQDLALAHDSFNFHVSIMLGNGDGTFQKPDTFKAGDNYSKSLAVGDLNGDGHMDVALAKTQGKGAVLLGDGNGTLQLKSEFDTGKGSNDLSIADFNGDGVPDLAFANQGSFDTKENFVSVLLGKGDGTFQSRSDYDAGNWPESLTVGDFDQNGIPDLAAINLFDNDVSVLLGKGDGTFHSQTRFDAGNSSNSILADDFNGDGVPDLACDDSVLLGNGNGTFQSPINFAGGKQIEEGDFNGDGTLDLAVSFLSDDSISILIGNGDGTFNKDPSRFVAGQYPIGMGSGDFNKDGRTDLAAAYAESEFVGIFLGKKGGTLEEWPRFKTGPRSNPTALEKGDFNEDRKQDVVVATQRDAFVFLQGDNQIFQPGNKIKVGDGPHYDVEVADFNQDDHLDWVVPNLNGQTVSVMLGSGDGSFQSEATYATGDGPGAISIADLNQDDIPDLVVGNDNSHDVSVLLGNSNGTFQSQKRFTVGNEGPYGTAAADFDGDGFPDVATANRDDDISILFGNGDGTLSQKTSLDSGDSENSISSSDLNKDDAPDLIVTHLYSDHVSVLLGNGNGSFTTHNKISISGNSHSVDVADVNGDQSPDLIVPLGDEVGVLLGDGNGNFPDRTRFIAGVSTNSVVSGQFDGKISTNDSPDASISVSPSPALTLETVSFDGSNSSDPDGNISKYKWDFGDGTTTTGESTSHSYSDDGTYKITLTVTDNDGATDSATTSLKIENRPPVAKITDVSPDPVLTGETVTFDGSDSSDPDGKITSHKWNFGDGSVESGETASHIYTTADTYPVMLTVTDDDGATNAVSTPVTVKTPAGMTEFLKEKIRDAGLSGGLENSLLAKLDAVIRSLNSKKGNARAQQQRKNAAKNQLSAFINHVQALSGKKISASLADTLISIARRIRDAI